VEIAANYAKYANGEPEGEEGYPYLPERDEGTGLGFPIVGNLFV
jgi:hypothetical protein